MNDVQTLFPLYAPYHEDAGNRRLHALTVPFSFFGLVLLFSVPRFAGVSVAMVLAPVLVVAYFRAHLKLGLLLTPLLAVALWIANGLALAMPLASAITGLVLFGGVMALQGKGHKKEARPPEPFTGPGNIAWRLLSEQLYKAPVFLGALLLGPAAGPRVAGQG